MTDQDQRNACFMGDRTCGNCSWKKRKFQYPNSIRDVCLKLHGYKNENNKACEEDFLHTHGSSLGEVKKKEEGC